MYLYIYMGDYWNLASVTLQSSNVAGQEIHGVFTQPCWIAGGCPKQWA